MTGLQWAVLTAYARVLPAGSPARQGIEAATAQAAPPASGQRVAVTVAEAAGMLERGRITEHGRTAAHVFLARLGVGTT